MSWGIIFLVLVALIPCFVGRTCSYVDRRKLRHSKAPKPTFSWLLDGDET